jgi:hypothetical protein
MTNQIQIAGAADKGGLMIKRSLTLVLITMMATGPVWAQATGQPAVSQTKADETMAYATAVAANLAGLKRYFPDGADGKNAKLDGVDARVKEILAYTSSDYTDGEKATMMKALKTRTFLDLKRAEAAKGNQDKLNRIDFSKDITKSKDPLTFGQKVWRDIKAPFVAIGKFFASIYNGIAKCIKDNPRLAAAFVGAAAGGAGAAIATAGNPFAIGAGVFFGGIAGYVLGGSHTAAAPPPGQPVAGGTGPH